MSVGSTSAKGSLQVTSSNGLSVSNGVISLSKGNASSYGSIKLSDTYNSSVSGGNAVGGVGASQNALYNAYNKLNTNIISINSQFHFGGSLEEGDILEIVKSYIGKYSYAYFIALDAVTNKPNWGYNVIEIFIYSNWSALVRSYDISTHNLYTADVTQNTTSMTWNQLI